MTGSHQVASLLEEKYEVGRCSSRLEYIHAPWFAWNWAEEREIIWSCATLAILKIRRKVVYCWCEEKTRLDPFKLYSGWLEEDLWNDRSFCHMNRVTISWQNHLARAFRSMCSSGMLRNHLALHSCRIAWIPSSDPCSLVIASLGLLKIFSWRLRAWNVAKG